ncbi:MAG: NAD(P)H-hydrate epimerase, partial [Chloroflexi bacterium]|nr:NAD(P)H-hydrate epimerase [Chloroflexota bacterium]
MTGRVETVVPAITAEQMAQVDRLVTEEWGIPILSMMELAGAAVAEATRLVLGTSLLGRQVVVLVGQGNNGASGLATARHLTNRGASVVVVLGLPRGSLRATAEHQAAILERMGLSLLGPPMGARHLHQADLIVEALLGYRQQGAPREPLAGLIEAANGSRTPILALDVPAGLEPTTGEVQPCCIRAAATLTLALPKTGLARGQQAGVVGQLFLADIGVPRAAFRALGLALSPLFQRVSLLPLALGSNGLWYAPSA